MFSPGRPLKNRSTCCQLVRFPSCSHSLAGRAMNFFNGLLARASSHCLSQPATGRWASPPTSHPKETACRSSQRARKHCRNTFDCSKFAIMQRHTRVSQSRQPSEPLLKTESPPPQSPESLQPARLAKKADRTERNVCAKKSGHARLLSSQQYRSLCPFSQWTPRISRGPCCPIATTRTIRCLPVSKTGDIWQHRMSLP